MNELIDKFLFELFDGLRDKNNCSIRRIYCGCTSIGSNLYVIIFWSRKLQNDEWR